MKDNEGTAGIRQTRPAFQARKEANMSILSNKCATVYVALFALSVLATPAQAQMVYEIEIIESEAVSSDIDMIETVFVGAEDDSKITGSVRRLLNTVNGELTISINERINDQNQLLLDDGTYALLYDGDVVNVKPRRILREAISHCRIHNAPGGNVIPNCEQICTDRDNDLPICNSVPPFKLILK